MQTIQKKTVATGVNVEQQAGEGFSILVEVDRNRFFRRDDAATEFKDLLLSGNEILAFCWGQGVFHSIHFMSYSVLIDSWSAVTARTLEQAEM